MRVFVERLVRQIDYGDQLSLIEVMQAGSDRVREFRDSIPAARNPARPSRREQLLKQALLDSFGTAVRQFTDTSGVRAIRSTDLLSTMRRVGDYVHSARSSSTVVVILSDMLHSTPEMSFERAGAIPGSAWIARQQEDKRVPDLGAVCVYAIGVDAGRDRSTAVRLFWQAYFAAAGASLEDRDYRGTLAPTEVGCPPSSD